MGIVATAEGSYGAAGSPSPARCWGQASVDRPIVGPALVFYPQRRADDGVGPLDPRACAPASGRKARSGDFVQLARRDVEDEPADRVSVRDERACLDPGDRLPDILVEVAERLGGPAWLDPRLVLYRALEVIVGKGEHA